MPLYYIIVKMKKESKKLYIRIKKTGDNIKYYGYNYMIYQLENYWREIKK